MRVRSPRKSGIHRVPGQNGLHSMILSKNKAKQTRQKLGIQKLRRVKILVKRHIIKSKIKI